MTYNNDSGSSPPSTPRFAKGKDEDTAASHHHQKLDEYVWPKTTVQLRGDLNQDMLMQSKTHRYYIIKS
jgi:hypothetical protein